MEDARAQKLIFIYNADSGLRNMILDSAHKILSPNTYECSLCDITFGAFTENSVWKKFRKETNLDMQFLHKDEFSKAYASKFGYKFMFPIILTASDTGFDVFIKTEELDSLEDSGALIALIQQRLH